MKKKKSKQALLLTTEDVQSFVRDKFDVEIKAENIIPGDIRSGSRQLPIEVVWKVILPEGRVLLVNVNREETDLPLERFSEISVGAAYILSTGGHIRYNNCTENHKAFIDKVEFNVSYSRLNQRLVKAFD